MTVPYLARASETVTRLLTEQARANWSDAQLLESFACCRDEAAFAALLDRHGSMVLRICRGVLSDQEDAEDAFQATFLVLACRAGKVRNASSVAGFLCGTAYRVSARARARSLRRRRAEAEAARLRPPGMAAEQPTDPRDAELWEEMARLPERDRQILLLCYVQGHTHADAARRLGWPPGSVSRRLRRACDLLRDRLRGRGVTLPAGAALTATLGCAGTAVPASLRGATWTVVETFARGGTATTLPAVLLAREVLRTMTRFRRSGLFALILCLSMVSAGTAWLAAGHAQPGPGPKATEPDVAVERQTPAPATFTDAHGDPLPPFAVVRLGTKRFRVAGRVQGLVFTPDGGTLASFGTPGGGPLTPRVALSDLHLWRMPTGREVGRLPRQPSTFEAVAFSADGKSMAVVYSGGTPIEVHDFNPAAPGAPSEPTLGKLRFRVKNGRANFLAFLADGNLLSAAEGRVVIWNADGVDVRHFGTIPETATSYRYALSADGKKLAMTGGEADVVVWDVAAGAPQTKLSGHVEVSALAFAPDGKTLAVGDHTHSVRLWNLATVSVTARLVLERSPGQASGEGDAIRSLAFTPDGKTLATLGNNGDGTIHLWDVASARERRRLSSQFGDGSVLAVSPDGRTLAVSGENNTIRLWDLATGKPCDTALGSQGAILAVAVAPNGRQVAVGGTDGVVRLWDLATAREIRSFTAYRNRILSLTYTPDGQQLLSGGDYEPARLWDVSSGKEVRSFPGSTVGVRGASFARLSPDGARVALTINDPVVQVVDTATGAVERTVPTGQVNEIVHRVAFGPGSRLLAGGGFDKTLHLWDVLTGKEEWTVPLGDTITAVAVSPDGRRVAAGTWGRENTFGVPVSRVTLHEAKTGKQADDLPGPIGTARCVAFSPDGRLLAVSGDEPVVLLYELASRHLVRRLSGHEAPVWSVVFTPDGRSLVSGGVDGTALVWDLSGREYADRDRKPLSNAELLAAYSALGATEGEQGYQKSLLLAHAPEVVPFLRARLVGNGKPDPKVLARWLADLDDDDFATRERATRELARIGRSIEADLRRARAATASVEVLLRLDALLARLDEGLQGDDTVRGQRAIAVLELAATPEARALLELLASKGDSDDLRERARGALDRLAKRARKRRGGQRQRKGDPDVPSSLLAEYRAVRQGFAETGGARRRHAGASEAHLLQPFQTGKEVDAIVGHTGAPIQAQIAQGRQAGQLLQSCVGNSGMAESETPQPSHPADRPDTRVRDSGAVEEQSLQVLQPCQLFQPGVGYGGVLEDQASQPRQAPHGAHLGVRHVFSTQPQGAETAQFTQFRQADGCVFQFQKLHRETVLLDGQVAFVDVSPRLRQPLDDVLLARPPNANHGQQHHHRDQVFRHGPSPRTEAPCTRARVSDAGSAVHGVLVDAALLPAYDRVQRRPGWASSSEVDHGNNARTNDVRPSLPVPGPAAVLPRETIFSKQRDSRADANRLIWRPEGRPCRSASRRRSNTYCTRVVA